jgi:hypothetical protein
MCHCLTDLRVSTCDMCTDELETVGTSQYAVYQVLKLFLKTGLQRIMGGLLSKYRVEASLNMWLSQELIHLVYVSCRFSTEMEVFSLDIVHWLIERSCTVVRMLIVSPWIITPYIHFILILKCWYSVEVLLRQSSPILGLASCIWPLHTCLSIVPFFQIRMSRSVWKVRFLKFGGRAV